MPTFADSCERRIKITVAEMTFRDYRSTAVFRFRMEASDAENMPNEIFVYRRHPINPMTGEEFDEFFFIASPVDLEEYPVGAPDIGKDFPFFRTSSIDLLFRSTITAQEGKEEILAQIQVLLDALCRMDALAVTDEIWIPGPPPTSSSASLSASA